MKYTESFVGKTITLMGLGSFAKGSGMSAAKFLAPRCKKLIVTDMKTRDELKKPLKSLAKFSNIVYRLGGHREADFIKTDLVVRNPDVPASSPYLALARKHKIRVDNDVTLFLRLYGVEHVIGVTGTRGKTTTTHLIHQMLLQHNPNAKIGGNVGVSPLTFLNALKSGTPVVLELSSFLLHNFSGLRKSPHIGVWTNLYPDHLNKYKGMKEYIADKQKVFAYQQEGDVAIINKDDPVVRKHAKVGKGTLQPFSPKRDTKRFAKFLRASQLLGQHNEANIMGAVLAAQAYGVNNTAIIKGVKGFSGVPYRLELIRTLRGVQWYNDSTATSPEGAIAGLMSFPKGRIIHISGGNSKGSDLFELRRVMKRQAKEIIVLPGNANGQLAKGIEVVDLQEAVLLASRLARKGDVVLLSPGLTWLPRINEFARGDLFKKLVAKL